MFVHFNFILLFILCAFFTTTIGAQVKETHQLIKEWVQTKQIISQEKNQWKTEKATLLDLDEALTKEIAELEEKLLQFEKENVGAAEQRANLTKRKESTQETSLRLEKKIDRVSNILPSPLLDRITVFLERIDSEKGKKLPLRNRLDALISLLQSVHLFHRAVHLERQEFTLDDGKSREFKVLYFGLGIAYFVNESGTVAGWGAASDNGWVWTRQDKLANEISYGVAILENRSLPRFLNLPIPVPASLEP